MIAETDVHQALLRHLQAIQENDIETYHATTSEDLTLYEWWITHHRIDGLPFHDFMMAENARWGIVFGSESGSTQETDNHQTRFDLSNLRIQRYSDTAICSYTLLVSTASPEGVRVVAHNETRVLVILDGGWKVVHVHKSPAWAAPHTA